MKLRLIRHLWGIDQTWEQSFPRIRAEGYVGIESRPPADEGERQRFRALLDANGFEYVGMIFTEGADVAAHVASFEQQLAVARSLGATQVTCHSGVDAWPLDWGVDYFRRVVAIERAAGVTVGHETHRGRQLFNPWQARDLMSAVPELRLCCDFSHWVCVAERLLADCAPILATAAGRCVHLHARVGYEEGPQVPDPSAREYATQLAAHESWWDAIWSAQQARGDAATTLTPEFGPAGYLHTLPHTNVPVADLWSVCRWMAERQAARFASRG